MQLSRGYFNASRISTCICSKGVVQFRDRSRSLTGLEKAAAKDAFSKFVAQHQLNGNQTEFLDLVIDSLTETGIVEPETFYESPFTDLDDMGIAGIFDSEQTGEIIQIVRMLNAAVAA